MNILRKVDTFEQYTMKRMTVWRWPAYTINWLRPDWDGQFCVPEGEDPTKLRSDPAGVRADTPPPVGHGPRPYLHPWGNDGPGGDNPPPPPPPLCPPIGPRPRFNPPLTPPRRLGGESQAILAQRLQKQNDQPQHLDQTMMRPSGYGTRAAAGNTNRLRFGDIRFQNSPLMRFRVPPSRSLVPSYQSTTGIESVSSEDNETPLTAPARSPATQPESCATQSPPLSPPQEPEEITLNNFFIPALGYYREECLARFDEGEA